MGRRDRTPSPPPRPPMGRPAPEGTYHFENYEDGKPKWAPGADNQRDYRDYRDSRREHRRPRKADAYDDAPPSPRDAPRQRQRRYSSSSDSDAPPPRRSNRRDRDEPKRDRDEPKRDRDEPKRDRDEPKRDRRREQSSYDSYDEHYPPRRPRDAPRRDGYVSDNRHNRPRDSSRDRYGGDRDRRDNRRDERYDNMFNNSRRDTRRYDDRDRDRRDRYDDRDDRYRDRPKSSGRAVGKSSQPEWQRQAISMFKDYAMPIIKKEGQKYIQKQMSGFGQKR